MLLDLSKFLNLFLHRFKRRVAPIFGVKMELENQISEEKYAADISSIKEAETRIKPFIHKTPVLSSESLNTLSGKRLFFKSELFQKG